jgi:Cu/Ag efflux pump CusA
VVVLVRHYQRLQVDGEAFGPELVTAATRDRVVPILTSAVGGAVVFIPFAVMSGAGFEIVGPMAAIILGGLISSTLLTLVVLPAAYLRFGFVAEPDRSAEDLLVQIPDVDTVGR